MNSGDQDAKPSVFTDAEIAYLHGERRLGRIGSDGTPHVVPVGWSHSTQHDTIDVTRLSETGFHGDGFSWVD